MSYLSGMMQPSIRVAFTEQSHMEPELGFEPGSARYKATAMPFELSSIDFGHVLTLISVIFIGHVN